MDVQIKLTSGVAIGGTIHRPGETIAVDAKTGRDLIARGKGIADAVVLGEGEQIAEVDEMTDEELQDIAAEYGLTLPKKFDRAKWVAAIRAHEAGEGAAD